MELYFFLIYIIIGIYFHVQSFALLLHSKAYSVDKYARLGLVQGLANYQHV